MNSTTAVIMAAGKSKRMKSKTPKVLHPLMGKALIEYVLDSTRQAGIDRIIMIVGHERELLMEYVGPGVEYAVQHEQKGTGHAVMQALPLLGGLPGQVLVLSGDMPLLTSETIRNLMETHRRDNAVLSVLTAKVPNPGKLGRIIRNRDNRIEAIVEASDATPSQLEIREINTGTYIFDSKFLTQALPRIGADNAQGEIYLTDTVSMAIRENRKVCPVICSDPAESLGVNSREDLAVASETLRQKINRNLMLSGVTIYDPSASYIEKTVSIEPDTLIYPGCIITGNTIIGPDCVIGPHCRIDNSTIGKGSKVAESVILESAIGEECTVGPYAHLRPGTHLDKSVKIGNFVEVKKSAIGEDSKVSHLSYVGDASIGRRVNVGAGTITCNYDGKKKNPTIIGDNAFIGSNSSLVAPVRIGTGSATGAGSVVTKDVPDHKLAVGLPARSIKTLHPPAR